MKIFANNKFSNSFHVRRMILSIQMHHFFKYLLFFFNNVETLLHMILIFYTIFMLKIKYSRHQNDETIQKMIKKIKKQTKIDEKKMKFKNENIYDFEDFENDNANNNR